MQQDSQNLKKISSWAPARYHLLDQ
jgi:hypothetical protein